MLNQAISLEDQLRDMPFAFEVGEQGIDPMGWPEGAIGQSGYSVSCRMRCAFDPYILDIYYLSSMAAENAGEWDNVLFYHSRSMIGQTHIKEKERFEVQDMGKRKLRFNPRAPLVQSVDEMRRFKE